MNGFLADIKIALVQLRRRPLPHLFIVGMLAASIAGTTAIVGVYDGLFLTPLPFDEPDRLVVLDETAPRWNLDSVSVAYPDFDAWRGQNETFSSMAVYRDDDFNVSLGGEPSRVSVARVTHGLIDVLKLELLRGRPFTPEEDMPGGPKVVLVGEAFWRERFGGDERILGTSLSLDGEPYSIIGILPGEAVFIDDTDLWIPLATDVHENPGSWYLSGIGRLEAGVTREEALADLTRVHKSLVESRSVNDITSPLVEPALESLTGDYREGATAMLIGLALVLLLACTNVSGLMLVRSATRARELGLRLALGARGGRLFRQILTESLVLAMLGGALGAALGRAALRLILSRIPEDVPRWLEFRFDSSVLVWSLVTIAVVTALSGLAPALAAARLDVTQVMSLSAPGYSAPRRQRARLSALVAAEVGLALALLTGALFVTTSFAELTRVDPGFRPEGVLTYRVSLPESRYPEDVVRRSFVEEHVESLSAIASVESAGAVNTAPFGSHEGYFFEIENAPPPAEDAPSPVVLVRAATPGYFGAMGVELSAGRFFDATDGPTGPTSEAAEVVVVNETFVSTFWPGEIVPGVLGKRIRAGGHAQPWLTVVGVAKDVKHYGLDRTMRPGVYQPYRRLTPQVMTFALRTRADPLSLLGPARAAMSRLDATLPMFAVATMRERLDETLWNQRASSWLVSLFSVFALGLAVTGIYGIAAHAVTARRKELSIRMVLGANDRRLVSIVLRQGMVPVGIGIAIGLAASAFSSRALASVLYDSGTSELAIGACVTGLVLASALGAHFVPAFRAVKTDPMASLRAE